jgi:hypothetical protein
VIEILVHAGYGNLLPAARCVAGFAGLGETAVVHVNVAVRALSEGDPRIPRLTIGPGRVAFFALHGDVLPGERITSFVVIEFSDGYSLPIGVVVALLAIRTQAAFMKILVAGATGLGCAEKCARKILDFDDGARRRGNMLGGMTFGTSHPLMFPFQNIPGKIMVESLGIPLDQGKVFAIVLGVALGTGVVIGLNFFDEDSLLSLTQTE